MAYEPRHMKWWGWGDVDKGFHSEAHPGFWPYAKTQLVSKETLLTRSLSRSKRSNFLRQPSTRAFSLN
jgi:hypothetical protein